MTARKRKKILVCYYIVKKTTKNKKKIYKCTILLLFLKKSFRKFCNTQSRNGLKERKALSLFTVTFKCIPQPFNVMRCTQSPIVFLSLLKATAFLMSEHVWRMSGRRFLTACLSLQLWQASHRSKGRQSAFPSPLSLWKDVLVCMVYF